MDNFVGEIRKTLLVLRVDKVFWLTGEGAGRLDQNEFLDERVERMQPDL